MNKAILIAIIAAAAVGVIVGVLGTSDRGGNNEVQINRQDTIKPVEKLSGIIIIDGSSTVYPITEVIAEEFSKAYPDVKVTVGISGTGGGFKRFIIGETDINDSSRPIMETEKDTASKNNVKWVEIPVALEGLTIVVHKDNNIIQNDCISLTQLRDIWKPDSTIKLWSDLDPRYPTQEMRLYGAGPDSGTFDYFTERVVGKAKQSRTDYIPSEDDNVLVQGVSNDKQALGYIPLAYTKAAGDKLKILKVAGDDEKCVEPTIDAIIKGEYPLARPLFIHINYEHMKSNPALKRFVEFYLENAKYAASKVQYIPLSDEYYSKAVSIIKEDRYMANDDKTFNMLYKE